MVESSGPFGKMIIVYELKSLNLHSDCHVMKITRSRPGLHNLTITPRNVLPAGAGASDCRSYGEETTFLWSPSVAGENGATNMKSLQKFLFVLSPTSTPPHPTPQEI